MYSSQHTRLSPGFTTFSHLMGKLHCWVRDIDDDRGREQGLLGPTLVNKVLIALLLIDSPSPLSAMIHVSCPTVQFAHQVKKTILSESRP